jgi:hypothetical protein
MRARVFISYAHANAPLVQRLYTTLVDAGQDAWRDIEDLPPGVDWRDGVMHAIEGSAIVLFVLTPESVRSEWCLQELRHARAYGKPFVPLAVSPNRHERRREAPPGTRNG